MHQFLGGKYVMNSEEDQCIDVSKVTNFTIAQEKPSSTDDPDDVWSVLLSYGTKANDVFRLGAYKTKDAAKVELRNFMTQVINKRV